MDLLVNLRAGIRLATGGRVEASGFRPGQDQLFLLVLAWLVTALACSYAVTVPPQRLDPAGFESQAFTLVLILGFAWLVARESTRPEGTLAVAVAYLATEPVTWIGFTLLHLGASALFDATPVAVDWTIWIGIQLWEALIAYRAARLVCDLEPLRAGALAGLYLAVVGWLVFAIPGDAFFYSDEWSDEAWAESTEPALDAEGVFHAQHALVERALAELRPGRPEVADLYFVGFGADASQNVFRSEVEFARELFDQRFETEGRSLVLLNHGETLTEHPIASASNLGAVLEGVGNVMDVEQDVLFLFLTGHGSREHELAVNHPGLPLNRIGPERLHAMLDAAGIQWRVVVVSACYAGGFVEPLRDERTLVMTAAAADRRSFGCSNEAEFTYFGRALFADELPGRFSFTEAFQAARRRIEAREIEEEKTPSQPQMAAGAAIVERLAEIERRLSLRAPALAATQATGS